MEEWVNHPSGLWIWDIVEIEGPMIACSFDGKPHSSYDCCPFYVDRGHGFMIHDHCGRCVYANIHDSA